MKCSQYQSYDDLPLFLNAETVAKVLGVSPSSGYELMHEPDFPYCASVAAWWSPKNSSSSGYPPTRKGVSADETAGHAIQTR